MVKQIPNAKITVQSAYERYEFTTATANIGSLDGGRTHYLTTDRLHDMKKFPIALVSTAGVNGYSIGGADIPKECPHEKALIGAAKAQERATLQAARIIEKAQEQAEAVINDADHTLNMAIQAYLHTGKAANDAARVLDNAGIYYNVVRVDNVQTLNTEDLYLLDATELLTVG